LFRYTLAEGLYKMTQRWLGGRPQKLMNNIGPDKKSNHILPLGMGAIAIILVVTIAGIAGSHSSSASPPAQAAVSCQTVFKNGDSVASDSYTLAEDQRSQDSSEQGDWTDPVNGSLTSQGQDLNTVLQDFNPYVHYVTGSITNYTAKGPGVLAAELARLETGAEVYLTDEGSGLMPGWESPYNNLRRDIRALARYCGES
jgi:hypothetical protein